MKVLAIIPALNEEASLSVLIPKVKKYLENILVIDDGSHDNSADISKKHGAMVLKHPRNMGKGAACRSGFQFAKKMNYDAVITIDSDGQHAPEDIEVFIQQLKTYPDTVGMIIGNRMNNTEDMPLVRRLTNKLLSNLISFLAKQDIPDSQCGFRLIHRRLLQSIDFQNNRFDAESEIIIRAARSNFSIESCLVKTIYGDQYSKINPIKDTYRFIRFYLKHLFKSPNLYSSTDRDLSIELGQNFNPSNT